MKKLSKLISLLVMLSLTLSQGCHRGAAGNASTGCLSSPRSLVTIYTRPGCPFCREAKSYLAGRGVSFCERDIEQEPAAMVEMYALYQKRLPGEEVIVPLLLIGDRLISGFEKTEIDRALNIAGNGR
jgi:glutaredoxin